MKNKNYVFSFLYVIGSIFIVAGHCKNGGINFLFNYFPVYSFHLGLFMFCSGYFYKDSCEDNFKSYLWKKVKRLILPMFIWHFIYGLFVELIKLKGFSFGNHISLYNLFIAPWVNGHQFVFTMCLWYIPSLFIVEIFTCLFRKILKKKLVINEYIFFIFYLVLGLGGIYLSTHNSETGLWLLLKRTLYFMPFYGLGILYNRKLEKFDVKINNILYFGFLLVINLIVIFFNKGAISYTPSWCNNFSNNYIMPFIIGFIGIAFWLRIAKILEPISQKSKIVEIISSNAYPIMVHQFLGFFTLNTVFAITSKFLPLFHNFNWIQYKSSIWYTYCPKGLTQFLILYLIAGIMVPIIIAKLLTKLKQIIKYEEHKKVIVQKISNVLSNPLIK